MKTKLVVLTPETPWKMTDEKTGMERTGTSITVWLPDLGGLLSKVKPSNSFPISSISQLKIGHVYDTEITMISRITNAGLSTTVEVVSVDFLSAKQLKF